MPLASQRRSRRLLSRDHRMPVRHRSVTLLAGALAAGAAASLCFAPAAVGVSFGIATHYPTGAQPSHVALRDLDADGKLDMVVVTPNADSVSVRLGDGHGGFGADASFPADSNPFDSKPFDIAVGDFNGDGRQDLATTVPGSGLRSVAVLLGDGSGRFAAPALIGVGSAPNGLATSDLDGDGDLDLAVTVTTSSVMLLRGDGMGGFVVAASYATPFQPHRIVASDLDADGDADLAAAGQGGHVSVLLGDGSGGFGTATTYTIGFASFGIAVRDLDGDGDRDLAVVSYANASAGGVSILLGDGSGGFGAATHYPVGIGASGVAIADFDGDAKPDLAISSASVNRVSVLLGDGGGGFGDPIAFPLSPAPGAAAVNVAAADLNGDDKPDLVATQSQPGGVRVLLNTTVVQLTASPDGLTFDPRDVAAGPTIDKTSTLTNTGTDPVTLKTLTPGGADASEFERLAGQATDCTPLRTLAPGAACDVRVRFDPVTIGPRSATMTVTSNAADVTIALTGTGFVTVAPPQVPPAVLPTVPTTPPCLKQVAFQLAEITTKGCFTSVGGDRYETTDAVKLNGIPFPAPPPNTRFVAYQPTSGAPGGRIALARAAIKIGNVTVFDGTVDWKLPPGGIGDEKPLGSPLSLPSGQKLFGLKIGGTVSAKLGIRSNGVHYATFPINIQLPDVFTTGPTPIAGAASALGAIRIDESGVKYDGLKLEVSNVYVGKVKVLSVCFSYVPSGSQAVAPCAVPPLHGKPFLECNTNVNTDRWDGNAIVELPTKAKPQLAVFGGVADQKLANLGGFVDGLGKSVPLMTEVYLRRVGIGLCLYPPPFKLKGVVGVAFLPAKDKALVDVEGYFLYTDPIGADPWSLEIGGTVDVLDRRLGSGMIKVTGFGSIDFNAQAGFNLFNIVSVNGQLVGWIETSNRTFNVEGSIRACLTGLCANAQVLLSSTGMAGCLGLGKISWPVLVKNWNWKATAPWRVHLEIRVLKLEAGFGYIWGNSGVDLFGGSCHLERYAAPRVRAAQTGAGQTVEIAAGTPAVALAIAGRERPPKITLTGPPGAPVISSPPGADGVDAPGEFVLVENPGNNTTNVLLVNPEPGTWTVTAPDPADVVTSIARAGFEAPADVVGSVVTHRDGTSELGMSYALPPRARLDVVERAANVERTIAADVVGQRCPGPDRPGGQSLLCFRTTFEPAFGPGGERKILAVITRDGIPLDTMQFASYEAPQLKAPSKPTYLRMQRRGTSVIVAWPRSRHAARHTLSLSLGTGKRFGVEPSKLGCRRLLIRHVPQSISVAARVAGVREDLFTGSYASATLRAGRSRTKGRARLPKRSCITVSGR